MRHKLITIEGNIGSGKTTVSTMLSRQYGAKLILEQFADNPFLPRFYQSPERYAFPLELYFMAERYQQLKTDLNEPDLFSPFTVTDYLFTKSLIFARVTLGVEEFKLYKRLFDIINPTLPVPDLIVYLYAPVEQLMRQIRKRGRDYEQDIKPEYLARLQETYMDYFKQSQQHRVLVVDVAGVDFLQEPAYYKQLLKLMDQDYPLGMEYVGLK